MAEHQRKIELQSNADLIFLRDNIRAAAQQQIDLHLPPSAAQGEDDAFRNKVDELVQQYIHETLNLALPSLSVNGLDASQNILATNTTEEADQDESNYEPYDTRLAQKLRDLYATLEEETTKVAGLRREAPKKATKNYMDALGKEIEADDKEFEARKAELQLQTAPKLDGVVLSNQDDLTESWTQSRKDLEELRNITRVKADLERAIRAAGEVEKR